MLVPSCYEIIVAIPYFLLRNNVNFLFDVSTAVDWIVEYS
jgi:hypothetical protein